MCGAASVCTAAVFAALIVLPRVVIFVLIRRENARRQKEARVC